MFLTVATLKEAIRSCWLLPSWLSRFVWNSYGEGSVEEKRNEVGAKSTASFLSRAPRRNFANVIIMARQGNRPFVSELPKNKRFYHPVFPLKNSSFPPPPRIQRRFLKIPRARLTNENTTPPRNIVENVKTPIHWSLNTYVKKIFTHCEYWWNVNNHLEHVVSVGKKILSLNFKIHSTIVNTTVHF